MNLDLSYSRMLPAIGLLIVVFGACSEKASAENIEDTGNLVLFDFEEEKVLTDFIVGQDVTFALEKAENNSFLEVANGFSTSQPGVLLTADADNPWSLEGYHQIMADVSNIGDKTIQVEMFVGNDPDGLVRWYCSDYVDLKPGESKTISVPLAWTPWIYRPQQKVEGMRGVPGKLKTDIAKIDQIVISSRYAYSTNTFTVDNVRASGKLEIRNPDQFFPFVDEFGQYIHEDLPRKTQTIEDLKNAAKTHDADLSKNPGPENRGKFGRWSKGPQLKATGFFRTEKYNDKWWMVDPEGYLFWSGGVNCVASGSVNTGISGFRIVKEELANVAPGQNYMGCRFAWKNDAVILAAAGEYLDIISFNKYEYSVEDVSLPMGIDAPIVISEFHFGATDRGLFHLGVKLAADQKERGGFLQKLC